MHVLYDDVRSSVLLAAHVIVKITTMMIMMMTEYMNNDVCGT